MPSNPAAYFQEVVQRLIGRGEGLGPHISAQARPAIEGGVNTNNLDYMTPGWTRDRTAGTHNTSGFPDQTIPAPNPDENIDQYRTRLHDLGFDQSTILSMTGPSGYRQREDGGWEWGWGTGPVTRDNGRYVFAGQQAPRENAAGGATGGRSERESIDDFYTTRTPGSGGSYLL
jgi:hypothetical protein